MSVSVGPSSATGDEWSIPRLALALEHAEQGGLEWQHVRANVRLTFCISKLIWAT